jgi:hypothetical protein
MPYHVLDMVFCTAPGCTDEAQYEEPNEKAKNGHFKVCKRHLDSTVDGVVKL